MLPTLMLAAWALTAGAEVPTPELGPLFLTPEERLRLDEVRYAPEEAPPEEPPPVAEAPEEEQTPPPEPVAVDAFRMDGMVVRSSGPSTAWVDGRPVLRAGRTEKGLQVDPRGDRAGVAVVLPDNERVTLKPGQAFVPAKRRVLDAVDAPPREAPARPEEDRADETAAPAVP
jgi:hypothetical protein